MLCAYIVDEDRRNAWRAHLHHRGPEPEVTAPISALVFKGSADEGSVVKIRLDRSRGLAVDVDGLLVQRLEAKQVPMAGQRSAVFRLDGVEFRKTFDADRAALRALDDFLSSGGSPPWQQTAGLPQTA